MPQTPSKSSKALEIRFPDDKTYYSPGETILGLVCRKAPIISPQARVDVSFHGREKSKVVVHTTNSSTTYRGRVCLIDEQAPDCSHRIFSGPLHIPEYGEEQVWPFAITIPTHISSKAASQLDMTQTFFPQESCRQASSHPLPSSFTLETMSSTEAFVEYFIEAKLFISGHSVDTVEAVAPIRLINVDHNPPIADFKLKRITRPATIYSYELISGVERADLSFKQKFKQTVGSTSVPKFHCLMEITLPTIFQLDNPTPVPFCLRAIPVWDRTSKGLHGQPQKVRLMSISLVIESMTEIKTGGTFGSHDKAKDRKTDLGLDYMVSRHKEPIYVPCTDEWPAINIGELFNVRLGRKGIVKPSIVDRPHGLYPGFTTYNIRHKHLLHWRVKVDIVGDEVAIKGTQLITLIEASDDRPALAPAPVAAPEVASEYIPEISQADRSESWIKPPAEEEAPPSFQEVQRENANVGV